MRIEEFLIEMPVASFDTVGELGTTGKEMKGFNISDWKVTHSQKAIAKIYRIFEKTPFLFNFIIVFRRENNQSLMFNKNMTPEHLSELVGKPVQIDGAITVVYNNHITSDRNRMPISAWTLAHRLGHAVHLNSDVDEKNHPIAKLWYKIDFDLTTMLEEALKKKIKTHNETLMGAMFCTFKSARDDNINSNWEVIADLFAQYLISGRIRLNSIEKVSHPLSGDLGAMDGKHRDQINAYIAAAETQLNTCMETVLKSIVGTIVGF